ncbi:MAG: hypothetical protein KGL48_10230 [Sphingomonadales bacterium]|nr:hypothetical protein [Sphingomonadales bacterium]MDE2570610.1 hypothetical protein [Sphingomonadales bacterium]
MNAGRLLALGAAFVLGLGYVADAWTPIGAGALTWVLAVSLLLGAPGQRGSELIGATAIWLSFAEFLGMLKFGQFNTERWLFSELALLATMIPIWVNWNRRLAWSNPHETFAQLDRRAAGWNPSLLPTRDDKLARLRGEDPAEATDGSDLAGKTA